MASNIKCPTCGKWNSYFVLPKEYEGDNTMTMVCVAVNAEGKRCEGLMQAVVPVIRLGREMTDEERASLDVMDRSYNAGSTFAERQRQEIERFNAARVASHQ